MKGQRTLAASSAETKGSIGPLRKGNGVTSLSTTVPLPSDPSLLWTVQLVERRFAATERVICELARPVERDAGSNQRPCRETLQRPDRHERPGARHL